MNNQQCLKEFSVDRAEVVVNNVYCRLHRIKPSIWYRRHNVLEWLRTPDLYGAHYHLVALWPWASYSTTLSGKLKLLSGFNRKSLELYLHCSMMSEL
jgi:hypothetical protein